MSQHNQTNETTTVSCQSIVLVTNAVLADYDCAWCGALKGADVHSAACPVGERYKQVQALGGIPFVAPKAPKQSPDRTYCLTCGSLVGDFDLTCDRCAS